ncbi:MAG: hypothetical protein HFF89_05150 [Oscillibacter sp.]|jgi:hypothetical protein|nr:hypothetical protein [Oscillibacter sp.]MCI8688823.1 hypothetical protein [Oscillibacter sp.]MCI9481037.1 hypothetical protein [Oscillibacter sp.]
MRANTDSKALRRRDALKNAVSSSLLQLAAGTLLLWFRSSLEPSRPLAILLLAVALLDFGMIIPIWISLKIRLKEIQGGEEDAAAQY